jgi:hypothetical protein
VTVSSDGRRFWERHAAGYDCSMLLLGGPVPRMLELVTDSIRGSGRVLEIASGTGLVTVAVAPVVGESSPPTTPRRWSRGRGHGSRPRT